MKPWVWIIVIALSPISYALLFQLYIYLSVSKFASVIPVFVLKSHLQTGSLVRTEAIITNLVFDHSLRVRLKAETGAKEEGPGSTPSSASASDTQGSNTPEDGSTHEDDDEETVHSRGATTTSSATVATSTTATTVVVPQAAGKSTDTAKTASKEPEKDAQKKKDNFLGKVNNLVTSDLDNIVSGRDFLFLSKSAPSPLHQR